MEYLENHDRDVWEKMFIDRYSQITFDRMKDVVDDPRRLLFSYAVYRSLITKQKKSSYDDSTTAYVSLKGYDFFLNLNSDGSFRLDMNIFDPDVIYTKRILEIAGNNGATAKYEYIDKWGYDNTEIIIKKDNIKNLDILIVQIVNMLLESGVKSGILPRGAPNEKEISQDKILLNRCITCDNSTGKLFKEISSDRVFCNASCQKEYYK